LGLVGARRRRRRPGGVVAVLASVLVVSSIHGCCDPAVSTDTTLASESSTTGGGGSTESTGDPGLPGWAIGVFSDQTDRVGTTIDHPFWYTWSNIEITTSGTMFYEQYVCSTPREPQEFRWTLADDGQSLSLRPVPASEVFTFGSADFISEVVIEPGETCDALAIRYFSTDAMRWFETEYRRGEVCATAPDPDVCTFTFEWCEGAPPAACE
jgi:hypothetical protein